MKIECRVFSKVGVILTLLVFTAMGWADNDVQTPKDPVAGTPIPTIETAPPVVVATTPTVGTAAPTVGIVTPIAETAIPTLEVDKPIAATEFVAANGWTEVTDKVCNKIKVTRTPVDVKSVFGKQRRVITYVYDNAHLVLLNKTDADGIVTKYPHPHDLYPDHVMAEPGKREVDKKEIKPVDKTQQIDDKAVWAPVSSANGPLPTGFTTVVFDAETGVILSELNDFTGLQTIYYYDEKKMKDIRELCKFTLKHAADGDAQQDQIQDKQTDK